MNLLVSGVIVLIVGSINFFSDHLMMVFRLLASFACLVPGLYLFFIKKKTKRIPTKVSHRKEVIFMNTNLL